jgi:hypothetical protein
MDDCDLLGRSTVYKGQSAKIVRRLHLPGTEDQRMKGLSGPEIPGWVQIEITGGEDEGFRLPVKLESLGT